MPRCPVHDADAIKARETEAERAKFEAESDSLQQVLDGMNARWAAEAQVKAEAQREAAVDAIENPLLANLTRLTGADIPIGSPLSAYPSLNGFREMTPAEDRAFSNTNPHTPSDLPPAA